MIFSDALKAIGQMGDPAFRGVLLRGIGLTILLFAGGAALAVWGVGALLPETLSLPWIGEVRWLDDLAAGTVALLLTFGSVFLMVPVASAFTSLFLDEVAEAVERVHYPSLPPAPGQPWLQALTDSLRFLGIIVVANVCALAVYLVFPPAAPFLFFALNGWLLGREYFQMVAMRRMDAAAARDLRRRNAGQIWAAGALMALPLSVPFLNLLVPVLGAAAFTHLCRRLDGPTS